MDELFEQLPKTIKVVDEPGKLTICERWFRWRYPGYLIGVICVGYSLVTLLPHLRSGSEPVPDVVLGVGAFALLGMAYWAFAGIVNTTTITATETQLTRYIGPLPWWGEYRLDADRIHQLFVTRKNRSQERMSFWDWEGDDTADDRTKFSFSRYKNVSCYLLKLQMKNERGYYSVSKEYPAPYAPRILEYLIEARMKIVDQTVRGEIGRSHRA